MKNRFHNFKIEFNFSSVSEFIFANPLREQIPGPSGRKKIAHRFNGGFAMQTGISPAGTAE
jgi:hypothetical protein